MPSKSIFFTCAISFIGLASGSPVATRSAKCNPNFEGAGVSVTNSAREWGVLNPVEVNLAVTSQSSRGLISEPDFRLEQTGQPATSYIIKPIGSNELPVAVRDGTLKLAVIDAHDPTQIWDVECDFCGTGAANFHGQLAFGCQIKSKPTGQCVQVGVQSTDPLFLATCEGLDSQNFDFWTETPN